VEAGAARSRSSLIGGAMAVALMWLSLFVFPLVPAAKNIDQSWRQALGHALKHGLSFGDEIIWTLGPLGYFYISPYDPDLFWAKLGWEAVIKLAMAVVFLAWARRLHSWPWRLLMLALIIIVLPFWGFDTLYILLILALASLLMERSFSPKRHGPAILLLAVVSLVKFTFLMLSLVAVLALAADAGLRKSWKSAAAIGGLYLGFLVAAWVAVGQSPVHLPHYLWSSLHLSAGFSEGLVNNTRALEVCAVEIPWALACLVLTALLILVSILAPSRRGARLLTGLLLWAGLFLAWKNGMVRQGGHSPIVFAAALLIPFGVPPPDHAAWARRSHRVLLVLCLAVSLTGLFIVGQRHDYRPGNFVKRWGFRVTGNVQRLSGLSAVRRMNRERLAESREKHRMPRIAGNVDGEPVDIFGHEQGMVLLNGFNWKPRPVFQGNLTFTPWLQERNARFFRSAGAPEHLIFKLQTIDHRFPTLDDSAALQVVLRGYRPMLREKGYLLLQRDPAAGEAAGTAIREVLLERESGFGERVAVPGEGEAVQVLALDIGYSLFGQLRKLVFRAPPVTMHVEIDGGDRAAFRLVPGMARGGFVFNPLLRDQETFISWMRGRPVPRITGFRLEVAPGHHKYFRDRIHITLAADGSLEPGPWIGRGAAAAGRPLLTGHRKGYNSAVDGDADREVAE